MKRKRGRPRKGEVRVPVHSLPRKLRYNSEEALEKQRACGRRYAAKPEKKEIRRQAERAWAKANPEKVRESGKRQHEKFPERFRAKARAYYARKKGKTDPRTRAVYFACCWLRKLGEDVVVDHIIPLKRGGEHVFWNLQIIERSENCRKNARAPTDEELGICNVWLMDESDLP